MRELANIYKETKYLDELFLLQYDIKSPEFIQKNILELLVEFGELANETKCFKYWSKKTKNNEKVLEEYIDCLFMVLCLCNIMNISLEEDFPKSKNKDIIDTFFILYKYGIKLNKNLKKETIKVLLVEVIQLSKLLGFTIQDLEKETKKKSIIIQERLNSDY